MITLRRQRAAHGPSASTTWLSPLAGSVLGALAAGLTGCPEPPPPLPGGPPPVYETPRGYDGSVGEEPTPAPAPTTAPAPPTATAPAAPPTTTPSAAAGPP